MKTHHSKTHAKSNPKGYNHKLCHSTHSKVLDSDTCPNSQLGQMA